MMPNRPDFIDLPPTSDFNHLVPPSFSTPQAAPSPRTGDIPPALSPLDAFAFQSKLLAKRFEQEENDGRRLSRLPPLMVASEIAKARPTFHAPLSQSTSPIQEEDTTPRNVTEVKRDNRPRSQYPVIHTDGEASGFSGLNKSHSFQNLLTQVNETEQDSEHSYFDLPRSHSPESIAHAPSKSTRNPQHAPPASTIVVVEPSPSTLAPPVSPRMAMSLGGSPNIQSVLEDSAEEPDTLSLGESVDSLSIRTPASPFRQPALPRSPSLASERSIGSVSLPRPSYNYSRPFSRGRGPSIETTRNTNSPFRQDSTSTRPSLEVPTRQDSADSPITPFSTDLPHTPVDSIASDEYFNQPSALSNQGSSYTYRKYSLPRGKSVKRESMTVEEFFNQSIQWDGPQSDTDILSVHNLSPRPSINPPSSARTASPPRKSRNRPPNIEIPSRSLSAENLSARKKSARHQPSTPSTTSNASTIKARLAQAKTSSTTITPEEHFQRGIECHEAASLQESTYHFRLAAKAGHSKAMLFYALACRHGWGMRPNQAEGVSWLQKAVDSAQLEVADDEDLVNKGEQADSTERKTHKAQFALSVYELGVSYMNGWGVRQDKSLALRCFEIAGNWGDADALAEAGFCYAEAVGCKKDLKKAARFYRAAEAKGMSMTGNSWIYKEKYMGGDGGGEPRGRLSRKGTAEPEKARNKSRGRAFFNRKKSTTS